jgi:hypothetical protein
VFIRMQKGRAGGSPSMGAAIGALDAVFNPGAARAREEIDAQHERVIPTPSPGDRLLRDGRIVITVDPHPNDQS